MPSLTFREQLLIVAVLAAVLLGVAVKHWRDTRREAHAAREARPVLSVNQEAFSTFFCS